MRYLFIVLGLFSLPVFSQENAAFVNDREGTSFYNGISYRHDVLDVKRDFEADEMIGAYRDAYKNIPANKVCAYDINSSVRIKLRSLNSRFNNYEGVIDFLRDQNEIDDVAASILLRANKVVTTEVTLKAENEVTGVVSSKNLNKKLALITGFEKRLKENCYDEAYLGLYADLMKLDKTSSSGSLEGILYLSMKKNLITEAQFVRIEQGRQNKLERSGLTLKSYAQKRRMLRLQFPLRDRTERSNFIAKKADKVNQSYRQRLYENYNEVQISLMANMIKDLRRRLESNDIEIVVHNRDKTTETIFLEPMDRFRFSIKKLRSEMRLLSLNSQFAGQQPQYMDLIAASYEVNFIAGTELEQLGSLEDIWNPKKSFWDKADVWLKTFSSVAAIVIPAPYGFIPTLVLVVIEATILKKPDGSEDNGGLFL
jgi:hypothetical protein